MWRFLPRDADLSLAFEGQYNYGLVALSVSLAIIAAFTALTVVEQASATKSRRGKLFWIALGALCLGFGIWCMHFIGMLGFQLPVPVQYDPVLTIFSFFPALIASTLALIFFVYQRNRLPYLLISGVLIALGIGSMHYTGMEAMHAFGMSMWYDPARFATSLLIAVFLAILALLVKTRFAAKLRRYENLLAAVVLGLAVSAMHYVAMSATLFLPGTGHTLSGLPINNTFLIAGIASVFVAVVMIVIVSTIIDRRLKYVEISFSLVALPLALVVIAGSLIYASSVFVRHIEQNTEQNVESALEASLAITSQAVLSWQEQLIAAAHVWSGDPLVQQAVPSLLELEPDQAQLNSAPAQTLLRDWFSGIQRRTGYQGFLVLDGEFRNIASSRSANPELTDILVSQPDFFERIRQGKGAVSRPFKSDASLANDQSRSEAEYPTMFAGVPIDDGSGANFATLLLQIDPTTHFAELLSQGSVGATGESYAIDQSGVMLSSSRFDDQLREIGLLNPGERSTLNLRITNPGTNLVAGQLNILAPEDRPLTLMARQVTQGVSGSSINAYLDYRGVPVVGAWRWLEDMGIGIAVEQNFSEAMSVYLLSRNAIVTLTALVIGMLFVFGIFLTLARVQQLENGRRIKVILDTMQAAVLTWDEDGIIESSNPAGYKVFSAGIHALEGRHLSLLIPALKDSSYQSIRVFFNVPDGHLLKTDLVTEGKRLNGELFPAEISINETILPSGDRLFTCILRDITERKKAEAELLQATTEKQQYESELDVARDIQQNMLPMIFPPFPERNDVDIFATLKPASEVGGDFYNFFELPDGRIIFTIGDVSGKGVPAALFMALTKTLTESHGRHTFSPAHLLTMVNQDLSKGNDANMFVTLFVALVDPKSGRVQYANGGHNPPYILTDDGELFRLDTRHGPVIGAVEGISYEESEIRLSQGDTLLMYTDGVTEAMNADQQFFGEEGLTETLKSLRYESATHIVQTIADQVDYFEDNEECQSDDITIMAIRLVHDNEDERVMVLELTLENRIEEINRVNSDFNKIALGRGIARSITQKFNIVFDELLSNIFYYGCEEEYHARVRVRIEFLENRIKVAISSFGIPFNPLEAPQPDTTSPLEDRNPGGLGVHLVRNMVDEITYYRRHNQNVINLLKFLEETVQTD